MDGSAEMLVRIRALEQHANEQRELAKTADEPLEYLLEARAALVRAVAISLELSVAEHEWEAA